MPPGAYGCSPATLDGEESPSRSPARLLRGRGQSGSDRRAGAGHARVARLLRKEIVHNRHVRLGARTARRDLRGLRRRESRRGGLHLLGSRRLSEVRRTLTAKAAGHRRDLSPGHEGPSRARGSRGQDARYARGHVSHGEIEGTAGEAPENTMVIDNVTDRCAETRQQRATRVPD